MSGGELPAWLLPALEGMGKLAKVGTYSEKAFPICHTKPMREGRGIPWLSKQVLVHTWPDKSFTIEPVEGTTEKRGEAE